MKLHFIDGNNVLRRKFEAEPNYVVQAFTQAQHGVSPHGTIVWVWDGANAKKKRQAIMPGYKKTSDSPDQFYKFMDAFRELLTHTAAIQIRCEGVEADDVIGTLVSTKSSDTEVFIDSNDQDYAQLISETVTLDYVGKDFKEMRSDDVRLYKTLVGDKSDEIPGLSRFGHKAFLKLTDTQKCLLEDFIMGKEELDAAQAKEQLGFTDAMSAKLIESRAALKSYWDVVGFFHIPQNEIQAGTVVGKPNFQAAQTILDRLVIPITMEGAA